MRKPKLRQRLFHKTPKNHYEKYATRLLQMHEHEGLNLKHDATACKRRENRNPEQRIRQRIRSEAPSGDSQGANK